MDGVRRDDVTGLLERWSGGDADAFARLLPAVYDDLRSLARRAMRRERLDHTLQATALVNEAYLRLREQRRVSWRCRAHFFGIAVTVMRRVLLHHAERQGAKKRGGDRRRRSLDRAALWTPARPEEMVALNGALDQLAVVDPRQARIVELRFFLGSTVVEVAEILGLSKSTVKREWRLARAWLRTRLTAPETAGA